MSYFLNHRGYVLCPMPYPSPPPHAPNLAWCWSFCSYHDRGLCRRKLANPSISLFPSFVKKVYIKSERSCRNATESLCSPKINTKAPTRTKNDETNYIVTNSETHVYHCLCGSRDFMIGKSSHRRRRSIKKVFLKISQNWYENACAGVSFLITLFFTENFGATAFE